MKVTARARVKIEEEVLNGDGDILDFDFGLI